MSQSQQNNTPSRTKQRGYTFYFAQQLRVDSQRKDKKLLTISHAEKKQDTQKEYYSVNQSCEGKRQSQSIFESISSDKQKNIEQQQEENEFIEQFLVEHKEQIKHDNISSHKNQPVPHQEITKTQLTRLQPKTKHQAQQSNQRSSKRKSSLLQNISLQFKYKQEIQKSKPQGQNQQDAQASFLLDTDTYKQICIEEQNQKKIQFISTFDIKTYTNFTNMNESMSHQNKLCQIHQKPYEIVCITDKVLICSHCALFGNHKKHVLAPYKAIKKDVEIKKGQINSTIKQFKDFSLSIKQKKFIESYTSIINQKKQKQLSQVQKYFQTIQQSIKNLQTSTLQSLQTYYSYIQQKIQSIIKQQSLSKQKETYASWQKQANNVIEQLNYYYNTFNTQKQIQVFLKNFKFDFLQNQETNFYDNQILNNKRRSSATISIQNKGQLCVQNIKKSFFMKLDNWMNIVEELKVGLLEKEEIERKVQEFLGYRFKNMQLNCKGLEQLVKNGFRIEDLMGESSKLLKTTQTTLNLSNLIERNNLRESQTSCITPKKSHKKIFQKTTNQTDRLKTDQFQQHNQQLLKTSTSSPAFNKNISKFTSPLKLLNSKSPQNKFNMKKNPLGDKNKNILQVQLQAKPAEATQQKKKTQMHMIKKPVTKHHRRSTLDDMVKSDQNYDNQIEMNTIRIKIKQQNFLNLDKLQSKQPTLSLNKSLSKYEKKVQIIHYEDRQNSTLQNVNQIQAPLISRINRARSFDPLKQKKGTKLANNNGKDTNKGKVIDNKKEKENILQGLQNQSQQMEAQMILARSMSPFNPSSIPQTTSNPTKQLQKYKKSSVSNKQQPFNLSNCNLNDIQILYFIQKASAIRKIKSLNLGHNKLTNSGFQKLLPYLSQCKTLDIVQNSCINSQSLLDLLIKKKQKIPNLKLLNINANSSSNGTIRKSNTSQATNNQKKIKDKISQISSSNKHKLNFQINII